MPVDYFKLISMKIRYKAKKGSRINYNFMGFTTFKEGWWFNHNTNKWKLYPEVVEKGYSLFQPCRTVKAFRRKLKSAPKGIEFILVSRWIGFDVICKN